jgi:hypothetical protein
MPLSFAATPIGALAGRSRPAGSEGPGVRAPLVVAGAEALPELAGADTPGVAVANPPAAGADTSDVAPARAPAAGADTPGRAGVAAAGTAVAAGVNVVACGVPAGR